MPWTGNNVSLKLTFSQGSSRVRATILYGIKGATHVEENDTKFTEINQFGLARGYVI